LHLVGILFPHINDDAWSKSHQHINDIFNKIKALVNKLQLWEFQLQWNNPAHISTCRIENPTDTEKHADIHVI